MGDETKGNQALCDVYSKAKGEYIELFPRTHTWQIRESINGSQDAMKQLATGGVKVTPINVKTKIGKQKPNLVCKGISIFKLGMDSKKLSRKHLIYDFEQVK